MTAAAGAIDCCAWRVIDTSTPTLAEQSIYTLIAFGAGAILVALDTRSPSSVLRIGSIAAGVASVIFIVSQHFLVLNPLFTDEPTGRIPFFNLLFLAYLLPAIAAGGLALYARRKRPQWYSQMLGLLGAVLLFVYATMSVRRLFHGEQLESGVGRKLLHDRGALAPAVDDEVLAHAADGGDFNAVVTGPLDAAEGGGQVVAAEED